MSQVIVLIPIALFLGLLGLGAFVWSIKTGQYDDLQGAAERILDEEDDDRPKPGPTGGRDQRPVG